MDELEGYSECIDRHFPDWNEQEELLQYFATQILKSRERARNAAIAVLGCFSHGRGAAVGEKDVGRIIGRAIWASRGIKEWMR
jgi:hypothetical protein